MPKQKKRWVLVADGARARIFIRGDGTLENALGQDFVAENLKESALGTSKPGRDFESSYSGRHAYEPRTNWHQYQKSLLAKELCDILKKASETNEFDELIIISPPKTLGDLRSHLNKQTTAKITAEIPKDVTKLSEFELMHFLEREIQ
jgi:protein required for attachment to host cells